MIVGSLVLILVAVVLLVIGLTSGSGPLLTGSIGASLLAAVALVVGARHTAAARAAEAAPQEAGPQRHGGYDEEPVRRRGTGGRPRGAEAAGHGAAWAGAADRSSVVLADPAEVVDSTEGGTHEGYPPDFGAGPPAQRYDAGAGRGTPTGPVDAGEDVEDVEGEDPPDEPAPQSVAPDEAARVARLRTDVLVVDGRPRYHLSGCVHLLGRSSEALPVNEAVELGFTPCGLCEPDTRLLEDARR